MNKQCSICGSTLHSICFHNGFVCDACIDYIKAIDTDTSLLHVENSLYLDDYDAKPKDEQL